MAGLPAQPYGRFGTARGSQASGAGAAGTSVLGVSMNLDFHPRYLLEKSNLPTGG